MSNYEELILFCADNPMAAAERIAELEAANLKAGEAIDHWHDVAEGWSARAKAAEATLERREDAVTSYFGRLDLIREYQDRIAELEAENARLTRIAAHATAEARVASGDFDRADFEMMLVARGFAGKEEGK